MKNLKFTLIALVFVTGCVKNIELTPVTQTTPSVTMVTQQAVGTFMNGVHTTTGSVKLVADKTDATKKQLVFENFKTDAGPDLRIYLAEDTKATNFTEVIKLTNTGTFTVDVPASAKLDKQKYVLIWCQQFTVLFGSAKLE